MAFSYIDYTGNGSSTSFSVPFGYISTSHVYVYLDLVLQSSGYSWANSNTIQFDTAPANGVAIHFQRLSSQSTPLVVYQDGSTLTQEQLQTADDQKFYMAQEAIDRANSSVAINEFGVLDAGGLRITNVADPVDDQDAATKDWVSTQFTAAVDTTVYAAQAAASAVAAAASALAASTSASNADTSELNAGTSEANALTYKNAAQVSASAASASESAASDFADAAAGSAGLAANYASLSAITDYGFVGSTPTDTFDYGALI
jgi:hypothetical protein